MQQLVFGIDLFDNTLRVGPHKILEYDHVAGLSDAEVRFSRDHHAERLQVRRNVKDSPVIVIKNDLTEADGPAFRRNSPQYICQEFRAEPRGRLHIFHLGLDFDVAFPALNLSLAVRACQQWRSTKIKPCRAAAMAIVHRGGPLLDDIDSDSVDRVFLSSLHLHAGWRLRPSDWGQQKKQRQNQQN